MADFTIIDKILDDFIKDKPFVKPSKDAKSDWFNFKYRKIEWTSNGVNSHIEIFPDLEPGNSFMSWNLCGILWYDEGNKRFHRRITQLKEVTLNTVEKNLKQKLSTAFVEMNSFEKKDLIEFTEFKSIS
jgi:hypothetical protein